VRDFTKVSPKLWNSAPFDQLDDASRLLYFYFFTSPHQNLAGCCHLPDGYACTDLRWAADRYQKVRECLLKAQMIRFDTQTSEMLILRWFDVNPPMNADHHKGIVRQIEKMLRPN
jgi:hypothetical protein